MGQSASISVLKLPITEPRSARPASRARIRRRHIVAIISFVLIAVLPLIIAASYLWVRAQDQFASTMSFTVRSEEPAQAVEMLGGLAGLGGAQSSDSDILFDYLHSQRIIEDVDNAVDLDLIWSRPTGDPIFGYSSGGTVEDLHKHWDKMVQVSRDNARGIVELKVRAFSADDAQKINRAILSHSTALVNEINNIAHMDAIRYAQADLDVAKQTLSMARQSLTRFRVTNRILDPSLEAVSQNTLVGSLQAQLAETLIELDILRSSARKSAARIKEAELKVRVITARIESEKSDESPTHSGGLAAIYGEFERLRIEVSFAEESYQVARARFDAAASDARRNTRYLAAHIQPTLAEQSEYPQRWMYMSVIGAISFLIWAIMSLVGFSMLDRR